MSLIGAIRWTAFRALQPNNSLVLRHSNQIQTNGSNRLINMFGKISQELKDKVPQKPKRPQSGYNIFYKDLSARIRSENPTIKVKDMAKSIGQQWRQLDPFTKQELVDKSKKDSEQYKQEIEKWKNSLTEPQKENHLMEIRSRKRVLAKRRLRSELKRLEYPIRPKTAFNLYIKEAIDRREKTEEPFTDVFKKIVSKWKTLSAEDKAPYELTAQTDKIRYLTEMKDWKQEIAKQDNKEMVERLNKLRIQAISGLQKKVQKTKTVAKKKAKKSIAKTTKSKIKAKPKSLKSKSKTATKSKSKSKTVSKSKSKSDSKESKPKKTKSKEKSGKQESESSESSEDSEK